MDSRDRLVFNLTLCFLHARGVLSDAFPLTWAESVKYELLVTPTEREEAARWADELEDYFNGRA